MFSGCLIEKADTPRIALSVEPREIIATSTGGIYTIEITSIYKNWKATVENDYWWCTPTPEGDTDGKLLTLTLGQNESSITRSTIVTITSVSSTSDTLSVEVKVTQAGLSDGEQPPPHGLFVDITYLSVSIFTAQYFIHVTSSHPWTAEVTSGSGWCFLSNATGEGGQIVTGTGNGSITLETRDNETQSARTATIRVYSDELNQEVTIYIWQEPNTFLAVDPQSGIEVPVEGGSYFIDIRSNTEWTVEIISENSEWCTLSNAFGSNEGTITVTAEENTDTNVRMAIVRVTAGADGARHEDVAVWQRGVPYLELTPTSIDASYALSSYQYSISCNNEWQAKVSYSDACIAAGDTLWCTLSSYSGVEDKTVTATVSVNFEDIDRIAYVTVTSVAGLSEVITITQTKPTSEYLYLKMIKVPGGTFTMGATPEQGKGFSDELPTHEVTLSSFQIMQHEVSEGQWRYVMEGVGETRPSTFGRGDNYPVENVSWNEVQKFIARLNELTGRNYRLPTEAEWEYAARGGQQSRKFKYSGSSRLDEVAWYGENSYDRDLPDWRQAKHAIRSKDPNELGIYDMTGNVWEWCSDVYDFYSDEAQDNPMGPEPSEAEEEEEEEEGVKVKNHVFRGGSWLDMESDCHVSRRGKGLSLDYRYAALGFRLVLPLDE
ncbi:hypothetical protein AGMMS4957_15160 [Bacteroidia bacterium]|nr:hypothetical protein AGMMS4957_15160 [Bacteroidia bacterium]